MKYFLVISFLFNLFWFFGCSSSVSELNSDEGFKIDRGLNLSHWLSQSSKRGEERARYMSKADFSIISEMGFDHVRIPIDEEHMWDESGNKNMDAFDLLHKAIGWAFENNLRVIVDLHVLRSHHFNRPEERLLWTDIEAQDDFIEFWRQLSSELSKYPVNKLAYEPLNEAVAENPDDWNKLINRVVSEIRQLEPERVIIMGSNRWQTVGTFKDLKVPENDPNIILSFHYYEPFILTHYQSSWTPLFKLDVPINYPGRLIDPALYEKMDKDLADQVKNYNQYFNIQKIDEEIKQAVDVAKKYNLKLYCGEFGAYPTTPLAARVKWYEDIISVFNKYSIAWSHWNYKNDFPLVDSDLNPIEEIINVLIPENEE